MADVLVMHPDAEDRNPGHPGTWEPGMIVDVFPDGQLGPGTQQHPRFIIVRIPGVPVGDVEDLLAIVYDTDGTTLLKKRDYKLSYQTLSGPVMATIRGDREITVTESQFRSFCERFSA